MPLPNVSVDIVDGGLGSAQAQGSDAVVVVGCASEGTDLSVSPVYTRKADLLDGYGEGPGVEAAAFYIDSGIPTIFCKIPTDTDGSCTAVTPGAGNTGASVVTVTSEVPNDDAEVVLEVLENATAQTDLFKLRYSLDGGITWSKTVRANISGEYTIDPLNVKATFSAASVKRGDTYSFGATGPLWNSSDFDDVFLALQAKTQQDWRLIHIVGPMSATDAAAADTEVQKWPIDPVFRYVGARVICDAVGFGDDDEATWMAALIADYASFASVDGRVAVGAGPTRIASAVTGHRVIRCASWHAVKKFMINSIHTDISEVVPIIGLTDITGSTAVYHDEQVVRGLDDARFITIRTIPGRIGYFITNPNTMAEEGSDFSLMQYGFVADLGAAVYRSFFLTALNKSVRVGNNGRILEKDAQTLEAGANSAVRDALVAPGHVSPSTMTQKFSGSIPGPTQVSRDDNILSTKTLTVNGFIIPLGYTKFIPITFKFQNPATQAAA